jgi:hypothetical protein
MGFDIGELLQKTIDSATPKLEQAGQDLLLKTATQAYDKYGTPIVDGLLKTGAVQLAQTLQQDPTKAQEAQQYLVGFTKEGVTGGLDTLKQNWHWVALGVVGLMIVTGGFAVGVAKLTK